jgi:hypothetical protein
VGIGLLGPHLALMNDTLIKFTPDLALLFAIGVLTSGSSPRASASDPGHGPGTRSPRPGRSSR